METPDGSTLKTNPPGNCGGNARARRLCDVCEATWLTFLAFSLACLDQHIANEHAQAARETSVARARSHARGLNQRASATSVDDPGHHRHVTELIGRLPRGAELCVLGAGNGAELDLETLADRFSEIHLADLDGQALERARDRQPARVRAKVVLHPDVDFLAVIEHLDDWGEVTAWNSLTPLLRDLRRLARAGARASTLLWLPRV